MDAYKTVVVVGAGASRELGLPMGTELKAAIADLFGGGLMQHDELTYDAIQYADETDNGYHNRRDYWVSGKLISQAMTQAISIDNFINDHRGDERIAICSKIAISRCILKAESESKLAYRSAQALNLNRWPSNRFDFSRTEGSWMNCFFRALTQNCSLQELAQRFSNVTFIIFNYDRCVETFATLWVASYHDISNDEAAKIVSNLTIYHPYGKVGELAWRRSRTSDSTFGQTPLGQQLHEISRGIKTFTEGVDEDASEICAIRSALAAAQQVVFLGFGFIELNMKLLGGERGTYTPERIIGTAYEVSPFNLGVIRGRIQEIFQVPDRDLHLSNETCSSLVRSYSRALEPR